MGPADQADRYYRVIHLLPECLLVQLVPCLQVVLQDQDHQLVLGDQRLQDLLADQMVLLVRHFLGFQLVLVVLAALALHSGQHHLLVLVDLGRH